MLDRRNETRMLCADLVDVHWKDKAGKTKTAVANLEDISLSGACLQMENTVPLGTMVKITCSKGGFGGKVTYCVYREIGYFIGIEFGPEFQWSLQKFKPQHYLDPRRLVIRALKNNKQSTSIH